MNAPSAASPDGAVAPQGLTDQEAARRLAAEGFNELPSSGHRSGFAIVREVLQEPMLLLLLGAGLIYLALGDRTEAIVLLVFASLSIVITVVQESRTERVLESLRNLTSPRALVIRDGRRLRIAGREVARGDHLVLNEGDRVSADAYVLSCRDLYADESLLTGESAPVSKIAAEPSQLQDRPPRPGGEGQAVVFAGSLIVRGSAIAQVYATGPRSEVGRIGQSLANLETSPPKLRAQTRRVVWLFAVAAGAVSLFVALLYGLLRGDWLEGALAGVALGMAMLPEEFPVVLAVFMAMGAWRISQAQVLTRRAAAIETLGSATVICTDKTGTLTENRMSVAALAGRDGRIVEAGAGAGAGDLPDLALTAALACDAAPSDPMERAFIDYAQARGLLAASAAERTLVKTYGVSSDCLAMSNVWRGAAGEPLLVAAKGAPETIAQLCGLSPEDASAMGRAMDAMAEQGMRVLGVARARWSGEALPDAQAAFDFEFAGLVGLRDPLRDSVPDAVRQFKSAGIRVVMITGDHPATALAIARMAGLPAERAVTGSELAAMGEAEKAGVIRHADVFARIMPEQKLEIVRALKAAGEVVAMTGDGVNDAPSLKAADIGIAMGGRGTDVAREASSIVLMSDDFASIAQAVRLGRRIYDNLQKAMSFIFAVHVPIAALALTPVAFGLPLILGPVHIAFLEMIIDPVCSLVFEAEESEQDVMRRPPRDPEAPLFSGSLIAWGLLQGITAFAVTGGVFAFALTRGLPDDEIRALTFFSLVAAIVSLIFVNRSFSSSLAQAVLRPSRALIAVMIAVPALLALTLLWPVARGLFRFGPLHGDDIALVLGAAAVMIGVLEPVKAVIRRMSATARAR